MGELEECGWKKAEEKKEAEVGTCTIMFLIIVFMMTMGMLVMRVESKGNNKNNDN